MALPASGAISMDQVRLELGIAQAGVNLNLTSIRNLAGVGGSGTAISMSQLHGKSSFSVVAYNSVDNWFDSQFGDGTATAQPSVAASGGSGYSYSWSITSNPSGASIGSTTGSSVVLSKGYVQNSNGSFDVRLNCTITNGATGQQITLTNIQGYASWDGIM